MKLDSSQFLTRSQQPLAPLWIIHGDALLSLEAADAIRTSARKQGFDERETLIVDASFRWDTLRLAASTLSLFGCSKLIDLRIPTGKPGREGSDALTRFVADLPQGVVTLITLPTLDWTQKKAVWFKNIADAKNSLSVEFETPPREHLPGWIAERLKRQQQSAPMDALQFIAEHVEGNLLAAHQEIMKLGLLHDAGELTLNQIETAVLNVSRYDINMLREALLEGDPIRLTHLLDGLKSEGMPELLVLWAFSNEIRTLIQLKAGLDQGQPLLALFKAQRIFGDARQRAIQKATRRLSARALETAILTAARIDRIIKGIARGNVWDEFGQLAIKMC